MNYRTERFPLVTVSLVGLNTLVYLVTLICNLSTGGRANDWVLQNLWLIPAQSYWWTYLTSMFVHGGIFHLAGNMLFLFLFGCCVEDLIGRWRFVIMYLAGGFIAELAHIAFLADHFSSMIPLGGASGAISACMGVYLLLRAGAEIEFKYFLWLFFVYVRAGEFELPAWAAIGFWFSMDVLGMVLDWSSGQHGGGVAFGAHIGGLLAGTTMIGIYRLVTRRREEPVGNLAPVAGPIRMRLQPATPALASPETTGETPAIYIHFDGRQSGPFTLSHIQSMLRLGSIGLDALYWSEGMTDWQSVAELSG
ncbi:MAG TPA: rhomboid family intramembrane serine protease [Verrucomicrobiae bacterium]|nr:rhomboid family intramembrane serine protease [Verrucomicrobiae bacterium]